MIAPDYQHPLAQLVDQLLTHREGGGYDLGDQSAALLEAAILEKAEDPSLNGALLALFGVADALHHRHHSLDAAANLLAVLGRVAKKLSLIPNADLGDLHERVAEKRRDLARVTGHAEVTPQLNGAVPKGAVHASSIDEVQRARMGIPPRGRPRT